MDSALANVTLMQALECNRLVTTAIRVCVCVNGTRGRLAPADIINAHSCREGWGAPKAGYTNKHSATNYDKCIQLS